MRDDTDPGDQLYSPKLEAIAVLGFAGLIVWLGGEVILTEDRTGAGSVIVLFLAAAASIAAGLSWLLVGAYRSPSSIGKLLGAAIFTPALFILVQALGLLCLSGVGASARAWNEAGGLLVVMLLFGFPIQFVVALVTALFGASVYAMSRMLLVPWLLSDSGSRSTPVK